MKTCDEAVAIINDLNDLARQMLRKVATERLVADCDEYGDVGSSDISCEAITMVQNDDFYGPDEDEMTADILRSMVQNNPDVSYDSAVEMFASCEK